MIDNNISRNFFMIIRRKNVIKEKEESRLRNIIKVQNRNGKVDGIVDPINGRGTQALFNTLKWAR